jgi:hypothetical protein
MLKKALFAYFSPIIAVALYIYYCKPKSLIKISYHNNQRKHRKRNLQYILMLSTAIFTTISDNFNIVL